MGSACSSNNQNRNDKRKNQNNTNLNSNNNTNHNNNTLNNNNVSHNNVQRQPNNLVINQTSQIRPITNRNNENTNIPITNRTIEIPVNEELPNITNLVNNINGINNNSLNCYTCHQRFTNQTEYRNHFTYCRALSDNLNMHSSINEILYLVQSLNRHLNIDSRFNILNNLLEAEIEENLDYFDWQYDSINNDWNIKESIKLNREEIDIITKLPMKIIKQEDFLKKRIWFYKYINLNIFDKTPENTTLVVSRENILEDSFNQFMTTYELNLKREMHIFFVDEVAQDIGGVYREWYGCLFDKIFDSKEGFFVEVTDTDIEKYSLIFNTNSVSKERNYILYFEFIGKVIGKAILDKIKLKANFNRIIIKYLLGLAIILEDLKYLDIQIYNSLKNINDNLITKDMDLTFVWTINQDSEAKNIELIEKGSQIYLEEDNKDIFIAKVIELITYTQYKSSIDALIRGFRSLIPMDILQIFNPNELNFILSGQSKIDIEDWRNNTIYKGFYTAEHPTIVNFWDTLSSLKQSDLKKFFKFCTGCDRVPIDGFSNLQGTRNKSFKFCIESPVLELNEINRSLLNQKLIEAKTCFNRILLPDYSTKDRLVEVIKIILENDTNFFGKQ